MMKIDRYTVRHVSTARWLVIENHTNSLRLLQCLHLLRATQVLSTIVDKVRTVILEVNWEEG